MLTIGAHLSASKGYTAMLKQAVEIGANTFQFFTRNPRGGSAKAIDENDVNTFLNLMEENNFSVILLKSFSPRIHELLLKLSAQHSCLQ